MRSLAGYLHHDRARSQGVDVCEVSSAFEALTAQRGLKVVVEPRAD